MLEKEKGLSEKDMGINFEGSKKISPQEINSIIGQTEYYKNTDQKARGLEKISVENDEWGENLPHMEKYKELTKWYSGKKKEIEVIVAKLEKNGDKKEIEEAIKELQKVVEEAQDGIVIRKGILEAYEAKNEE